MNPPDLKRILYVSRPTPEAASRLMSTMEDILVVSSRWNLKERITGLLWSDGLTFCQVLEGPAAKVDALFGRILVDPRNRDVTLRQSAPVAERSFPCWSMCGITLSDLDEAVLAPAELNQDLFRTPADKLLAGLTRIAQTHADQLDRVHADIVARSGPA